MILMIDQVDHLDETLTYELLKLKQELLLEHEVDDVIVKLLNELNLKVNDLMDDAIESYLRDPEDAFTMRLSRDPTLVDEEHCALEAAIYAVIRHVDRVHGVMVNQFHFVDRCGRVIFN